MPTYKIRNKKTEEIDIMFCSWSKLQEFLESNDDWCTVITAPSIVSSTKSVLNQTSDGWKDILKGVKKGSDKTNTINS